MPDVVPQVRPNCLARHFVASAFIASNRDCLSLQQEGSFGFSGTVSVYIWTNIPYSGYLVGYCAHSRSWTRCPRTPRSRCSRVSTRTSACHHEDKVAAKAPKKITELEPKTPMLKLPPLITRGATPTAAGSAVQPGHLHSLRGLHEYAGKVIVQAKRCPPGDPCPRGTTRRSPACRQTRDVFTRATSHELAAGTDLLRPRPAGGRVRATSPQISFPSGALRRKGHYFQEPSMS